MSQTGPVLKRGPPTDNLTESNKEIDAFAGCGFLGFWVGTATGKGYERKMRGDERNMKGSNKNLKGKSRKMQADERIVRNFPPGEIK